MKWHEKPINVIVLTILFWPLGLYYMWTNKMLFFKNKTLSKDSQSEPKPSDTQTVSSGPEASKETSSDELKELEDLKDAGILTEEEFQQKKKEILSPDTNISQIEEKTTPDITVCDICGHQDWDEKDEQHNELIEIYLEFDDDYEDCVGIWCKPCKETIEMDIIEIMSYDYIDYGEAKIIISQEGFDYINKSKKSLLDNVVMRNRGELD